jgi:hypothetical protein
MKSSSKQIAQALRSEVVLWTFPGYGDPEVLLGHGIAAMVRLTGCGDEEVEFEAAKWLVGYAGALRKTKLPVAEEERAVLMAELRTLYAQALPAKRAEALVLEASLETPEERKRRN